MLILDSNEIFNNFAIAYYFHHIQFTNCIITLEYPKRKGKGFLLNYCIDLHCSRKGAKGHSSVPLGMQLARLTGWLPLLPVATATATAFCRQCSAAQRVKCTSNSCSLTFRQFLACNRQILCVHELQFVAVVVVLLPVVVVRCLPLEVALAASSVATHSHNGSKRSSSWARLVVEWPSERNSSSTCQHRPTPVPHPRPLALESDGLPWQFAAIFMIKGERLTKFKRLTHFQR